MSLADELQKLEHLRNSGAISEEEYQRAKSVALSAPSAGQIVQQIVEFLKRPATWAALIHLSVFAGYLVPLAGFVAPLVFWQTRKEDPFVDAHGRIVFNGILSFLIWFAASLVLAFFLIGFAMFWVLGVLCIFFPLFGAVKAFQGKVWEYPLTISFFRVSPGAGAGRP